MKLLAVPVLVLGLLLVPSYAEAQTPDPIVEAIEAIEVGTPFRTKSTGGFTVKLFDITMKTDVKSSTYTDVAGNTEGKMTMTMKIDSEKIAMSTEYKYFPGDDSFYFKLDKLPKGPSSSLEGIRAKTWYVTTVDDTQSLAQVLGQAQLTGKYFLEAQEKYPVITFVEKGSTKKEHKYTYTIDKAQLEKHLMEQARLAGEVLTASEAELSSDLLDSLTGTFIVNKKTMRIVKTTQQVGSSKDVLSIKNAVTYSYGGGSMVLRPAGAVRDEEVTETLFPTL